MDSQDSTSPTTTPPLSDDDLTAAHPALLPLVTELEDIARRDPSTGVVGIASALARYFRTAD